MHVSRFTLSTRSSRGSTLLGVILFTTVMMILVGSILRWSLTERRMNVRNAMRLESRNAAEALAEFGFSQIREKFETRSTFNLNPSGTDALRLPPSTFWANSRVDAATGTTTALEMVGGTIQRIPAEGLFYVDPLDQNNEFDPLKGKWIFRRDVAVIAKATIMAPAGAGAPITSYVSERISVRGAPLFAHAIFYNMDLEIFPGPTMNIYGPVHTNGNLFVSSQGSQVNFRGGVTTAGQIYHAWKSDVAGTRGSGSEGLGSNPVRFLNRSGSLVDMKDASNVWKDSLMGAAYNYNPPTATNPTPNAAVSSYRAYASQTWNGNVQTSSHGISNYAPVAIGRYAEDPSANNGVDNSNNSGRAIIEPSNYPAGTDVNYAQKIEIETQKYANDAGIYVKVNPVDKKIVKIISRKREDPAKEKVLMASANSTHRNIFTYIPYEENTTDVVTGSLTPPTPTGGGTSATTSVTQPTTTTVNSVTAGLYDLRRARGVDLVDVDIAALKLAVAEMQKAPLLRDTNKSIGDSPLEVLPTAKALNTTDWTGIIYIEVEGAPTTNFTDGSTTYASAAADAAADRVAVRIRNGRTNVPTYGTVSEGLTIATNVPLYVKGSYNADGVTTDGGSNPSLSSANKPDANETPAALVADAITLLSEGFSEANSGRRTIGGTTTVTQRWTKNVLGNWVKDGDEVKTRNSTTVTMNAAAVKPAATADVEVAAALLMGLTPTNKDGNARSSGGAHNFPRFLENWTNRATWIRGSLVSLFESRIATEIWSTAYYDPPARNWGFNDLFRQGRFPPGTPRVLSYKRVDFTDLTKAQYDTLKASFNWGS